MTLLHAMPCPLPQLEVSTHRVCYGCNEVRPATHGLYGAGGGPWWCTVCREAVASVHAKMP